MNQSEATGKNLATRSMSPDANWRDAARRMIALFQRIAAMDDSPRDTAEWQQALQSEAARQGIAPDVAARLAEAMAGVSGTGRQAEQPPADGRPSALARGALRIDHVAIAVKDLESAICELRERYGFEVTERREILSEASGMVSATLACGGVTFVLCQGTGAASNVSRFVNAFGQGVQHLAIEVLDEREVIEDLKRRGADLLTEVISGPGLQQAFTRRSANTGMQLEFVSRSANQGFDDQNVTELYSAMEREDVF